MAEPPISFNDGAAYERNMGVWSGLAGEIFLDWLAPAPGLDWIDVGCGNGAFTERIFARARPATVRGVDPSEAQIAYARTRPGAAGAEFQLGDAMALPFADRSADVAVMALVIFFVPDPGKGVAEMARAVRPGGLVAAYAWDFEGGGFPLEPVLQALRALGYSPALPPSAGAERPEALAALWQGAGIGQVAQRTITVRREFPDFEEYFGAATASARLGQAVAAMAPGMLAELRARTRAALAPTPSGGLAWTARANAISGRLPG